MSDKQKPSIKERIREEAKEFAVIILYLWVLLSLFALHRGVLLRERNLVYRLGFALVNALVLGKIMYMFEHLRCRKSFWTESTRVFNLIQIRSLCHYFVGF
jgi:hypothetical protein